MMGFNIRCIFAENMSPVIANFKDEADGLEWGALERVGGSNLPVSVADFLLVIGNVFRFVVLNRPSTPLHDAQLGGYFYACMAGFGSEGA